MDFSSVHYAELLQRLLAPTWRERRAADKLLWMLLMAQALDDNGRRQGAIAHASDHLGSARDGFLAAVIAFWADRSAAEYRMRMAGLESGVFKAPPAAPAWTTKESAKYPLADPCEMAPSDLYGLGISAWLSGIGPIATGRVGQLEACLQHPEPTVSDTAIDALGSIGPAARSALPALLADVRRRGYWCHPFRPGIAIARIIAGDSAMAEQMVREIDPEGDENQVTGPCAVLGMLPSIGPVVIDALLKKLNGATSPPNQGHLLAVGAQWAARVHYAAADFRHLARSLAGATETELRSAAASALGNVGSTSEDAEILKALTCDADWTVRSHAHSAAALWPEPSPELVRAVAQDLGNFDGYDGEPHGATLNALIRWGEHAAVALPTIDTWIKRYAADPWEYGDRHELDMTADLVEALGPKAIGLREGLQRLVEACGIPEAEYIATDVNDGIAEEEHTPWAEPLSDLAAELAGDLDAMKEEQGTSPPSVDSSSADALELARKLGFPLNQDTPGTEPKAAAPDSPDARDGVQRLRHWLRRTDRSA